MINKTFKYQALQEGIDLGAITEITDISVNHIVMID